jgi:hypothetical protein
MPAGIERTHTDTRRHRPRSLICSGERHRHSLGLSQALKRLELWGLLAYSSNGPERPQNISELNLIMKNPLDSVGTTVTLGVLFSILVMVLPNTPGGEFSHLSLGRWAHTVTGIFWIGLLYYFNVAQIPALAAANADSGGPGGAGIVKYVAPRALLWFRWAAVATWLTGAWLLGARSVDAFLLQPGSEVIGIGVWLGTIMLFNVWVLIWPNQKKVIGLVPATDEEKAKARRTATLTSRVNFLLSFPMLLCMGGSAHGLPY